MRLHRWGLGFRQCSFSPYRAGLAGRHLQRLPVTPASPTCSFPLRLSPSGQSDDPGASLRAPPDCVRDSTPRSAARTFASSGSPVGSNRALSSPISLGTVVRIVESPGRVVQWTSLRSGLGPRDPFTSLDGFRRGCPRPRVMVGIVQPSPHVACFPGRHPPSSLRHVSGFPGPGLLRRLCHHEAAPRGALAL